MWNNASVSSTHHKKYGDRIQNYGVRFTDGYNLLASCFICGVGVSRKLEKCLTLMQSAAARTANEHVRYIV
jgi:TPR repeat protein